MKSVVYFIYINLIVWCLSCSSENNDVPVDIPDSGILNVIVPNADALSGLKISLVGAKSSDDKPISFTWKNGYFQAIILEQTLEKEKVVIQIENETETHTFPLESSIVINSQKVAQVIVNPIEKSPEFVPNTFVVPVGGEIFISVAKSYYMWEKDEQLATLSEDLKGEVSGQIVWQEGYNSVIEDITVMGQGREALLHIKTKANKSSNAIVGVKIGDKIRWSWQLWVTNYNPNTQTEGTTYTMNGLTFMDRNLGAIQAGAMGDLSLGMYYQWGRKDPFPTRGNLKTQTTSTNSVTNIALSITNPETYIVPSSTSNDWYATEKNQGLTRWNSSQNKKTAFDPCPRGWRVPLNENKQSPWKGLTLPSDTSLWGNGWYFNEKAMGYYPASGQRTIGGQNSYVGSAGYYHTALHTIALRFDYQSINTNFSAGGNATGRCIRCMKE